MNIDKIVKQINGEIDERVRLAITNACLLVENEAKMRCPVDTGLLRSSITHEVYQLPDAIIGEVGSNQSYAIYVEKGTGLFAVDGDGRKTPWSYQDSKGDWHTTVGQHPQPYLQPALESLRPQIDKLILDATKGIGK